MWNLSTLIHGLINSFLVLSDRKNDANECRDLKWLVIKRKVGTKLTPLSKTIAVHESAIEFNALIAECTTTGFECERNETTVFTPTFTISSLGPLILVKSSHRSYSLRMSSFRMIMDSPLLNACQSASDFSFVWAASFAFAPSFMYRSIS